jgi:hypothetical protein
MRARRLLVAALAALCAAAPTVLPDSPSAQALAPPLIDGALPPPLIAPGIGPLSGRKVKGERPVLVVKIDNVQGAFPQAGVNDADLVYVEEVEGGLTRLAAVYSSRLPKLVGPVRSARTDNVQLLLQFGRPTIAYSGANRGVLRTVRRSPLRSAEAERLPSKFRRLASHRNPHDLFLTNVQGLLKSRPAGLAYPVGFTFSQHASGGRPAAHLTVRYPRASLRFDYNRAGKRWELTQDGRASRLTDGSRIAADSVIVQHIIQRRDINGHITPFNETIGSGKVAILRDGKVFKGTWVRNTVEEGTRYYDAQGRDIPLRPGTTWVVLLPTKHASARVS